MDAQSTVDYILRRFALKIEDGMKMPIDIFTATRADLAELFAELDLRSGAEIGVERGHYSKTLLKPNPNLTLHLVDAWKAYRGYRDHVTQSKMDGFYEEAQERLRDYPVVFHRGFSMDVVQRFSPGQLDFVYIDGNHSFDWVMLDIIEWSKKVRSGGIVSGHDFIRRLREPVHVIKATCVYTEAHKIRPWFTVGGATKETRSWFWVKP